MRVFEKRYPISVFELVFALRIACRSFFTIIAEGEAIPNISVLSVFSVLSIAAAVSVASSPFLFMTVTNEFINVLPFSSKSV